MSSDQEEREVRHDHRKPSNRYTLSSSDGLKDNDVMRRHVLRRLIFFETGSTRRPRGSQRHRFEYPRQVEEGALTLIGEADRSKTA